MHIGKDAILGCEKQFRTNLINSVSGFKSASLIGTISAEGRTNLSLFSSVIHVGANPPLLGLLMRPLPGERHTYRNIRRTGCFTVNHVTEAIFRKAHQTSARYPEDVSEFDACGLSPEFSGIHTAPYVKEAAIKIGAAYREEHEIAANGTVFVVGEIVEIMIPEGMAGEDGYVDLEKAGSIAISGLDGYHSTNRIARLSYAKPGTEPKELH